MEPVFKLESVEDLDEIIVPKRVPRIERVPVLNAVEGTVVCDRLWKLPTHFASKRTSICPGKSTCTLHKIASLRIYFLCAVYVGEVREVTWFQLPANAAKALLFGVKTLGRPLLGTAVKIGRKWKDKNAPVTLSVNPYSSPTNGLPKPMTPEESVRRCFFSDAEKPSTNRRKSV